MRIVCISDTHTHHRSLSVPDGDVLVHCGDSTKIGRDEEISDVDDWFGDLPHKHKILIAGNHDFCFQTDPLWRTRIRHAHYLQDEALNIGGVRFYGSPWQPRFFNWAFNLDRGTPLRRVWDRVPDNTDVLLTHGPPFGILDLTDRGEPVGDEELRELVLRLPQLKLHVFGHIHESYGQISNGYTTFVNACSCNLRYRPVNPPIVIDL